MTQTTKVKICGITNPDDAYAAACSGADFLGYVFHPASKRWIEPTAAGLVISDIREQFPHIQHVGVFVNLPIETLTDYVRTAGLDIAQLHSSEPPRYYAQAHEQGICTLRVLRIGPGAPACDWHNPPSEYFLCDTFDAANAGGTGRMFDPALLPDELPLERCFIAGGLTPDNVAEVVRSMHPFAVDVSSGVEASPGRKSHELIEAFISAVRRA